MVLTEHRTTQWTSCLARQGGSSSIMQQTSGSDAFAAGSQDDTLPDGVQLILQDHERQLEICNRLENLVSATDAEPMAEWAGALLSFLLEDLPLHITDEELDLFPRLKERQPAEESNLRDILDQLTMEHETDRGLAELVIEDLRTIAGGASPEFPARFQMNVRAFCEMQRRHLNWENRVLLPLAEVLLTQSDRQDLAHRMLGRRNASQVP